MHWHSHTCPSWLFLCATHPDAVLWETAPLFFTDACQDFIDLQVMNFAVESMWFPTNVGTWQITTVFYSSIIGQIIIFTHNTKTFVCLL